MSSAFLYLGIVVMWLCVLVPMWLRHDRNAAEQTDASYEDGDTLTDVPVPPPAIPDDDTMNFHLLTPGPTTPDDPPSTNDPKKATAPFEAAPRHEARTEASPRHEARTEATPRHEAVPRTEATPRAEAAPRTEYLSPAEPQATPHAKSAPRPDPATPPTDLTSSTDLTPPTDEHQDPGLPEEPAPTDEARRRARIMARRRQGLLWSALVPLGMLTVSIAGLLPWWSVPPSLLLLAGYLWILRVSVTADRERHAAVQARADRDRRTREHREAEERAAQQAQAEILEFRSRIKLFDQHADRRRASGD